MPPPSRSWMLAPRFEHEATPLHVDERVAFAEATVEPIYSAPTTSTARWSANHDLKEHRRRRVRPSQEAAEGRCRCTYRDARVAASCAGASPGYGCAATNLGSVETAGERRSLALMFCDLLGSTGIAAKLDAAEWRDVVGAYLDAVSAAVREIGGQVTK